MAGGEGDAGRRAPSGSAVAAARPRYAGLDLIRFAAAAAVMLFHLGYWSWRSPADLAFRASAGRAAFPELTPLTWFCWVGVEVFFVLSGLVIANSATSGDGWRFVRGRMGRLLPGMWLCIAVAIVATAVLRLETPWRLVLLTINSLMLWPYGPWLDGVFWTLPIEIAFYGLIWVILIRRRIGHIERYTAVLATASALYWLARSFGIDPLGGTLSTYLLLRHGCFFALGILLWSTATDGLTIRRAVPMLIATGAGLIEIGETATLRVPPGLGAWAPAIYWLLMIGLMYGSLRYSDWLPISTENWTRRLGLMTYPLYLVHGLIGCGLLRTAPMIGRWPALGLGIVASLVVAYAVVLAEPAVRNCLYRLLDRSAARAGELRGARFA